MDKYKFDIIELHLKTNKLYGIISKFELTINNLIGGELQQRPAIIASETLKLMAIVKQIDKFGRAVYDKAIALYLNHKMVKIESVIFFY